MNDDIFNDFGKTEPMTGFGGFGGDTVSTEQGFGGFGPETVGMDQGFGDWKSSGIQAEGIPTIADTPGGFRGMGDEGQTQKSSPEGGLFEDPGVTVVVGRESSPGYMPVVGWLVCIEGNDRGRDFRVHAGYNTIGKSADNDICIPGDNAVSRERHALLAYDEEENIFFFAPGNGINLLRLNGKVLMAPTEIKSHDVLTIGQSKLIFVPLCSDSFRWSEKQS